jgi:hypothetical protein
MGLMIVYSVPFFHLVLFLGERERGDQERVYDRLLITDSSK